MTKKLANLQNALDRTRTTPAANDERQTEEAPREAAPRQANRVGRVNLGVWLHPDYKSSLRLVQARRSGTLQELVEEALNDLYAKYNVPQVIDRG
jgi:hypothetical protein